MKCDNCNYDVFKVTVSKSVKYTISLEDIERCQTDEELPSVTMFECSNCGKKYRVETVEKRMGLYWVSILAGGETLYRGE